MFWSECLPRWQVGNTWPGHTIFWAVCGERDVYVQRLRPPPHPPQTQDRSFNVSHDVFAVFWCGDVPKWGVGTTWMGHRCFGWCAR